VGGDNELLVDLDAILSVESFARVCSKAAFIVLEEAFLEEGDAPVRGGDGRYLGHFLMPIVSIRPEAVVAEPHVVPTRPRSFGPGSEWAYVKAYCQAGAADAVLADLHAKVIAPLAKAEDFDRWFFIRFVDPDHHLRLRFHGDPERLRDIVLPALFVALESLKGQGLVRFVQHDTYDREVERYGGDRGIELAESIFAADSALVCSLLTLDGPIDPEVRWRLALLGCHHLLCDLLPDSELRLALVKTQRAEQGSVFSLSSDSEHLLRERFHALRHELTGLLAHGALPLPIAPRIGSALERRRAVARAAGEEYRALEASRALTTPLTNIVESLIHMWVNRLGRSAQPFQEFVLYDYLVRSYESQAVS
jgi:thiopeptide-type bacteriocin biosynthesis protein